jgi:hypothetical protein
MAAVARFAVYIMNCNIVFSVEFVAVWALSAVTRGLQGSTAGSWLEVREGYTYVPWEG